MKRSRLLTPQCSGPARQPCGGRSAFTLIELLVSVILASILLLFVVNIFRMVGDTVNDSRALLDLNSRLRTAGERLRKDLDGATAEMIPPLSPDQGLGYLQYDEGPMGPVVTVDSVALNTSDSANPGDSSVNDKDDTLRLTVRSRNEPFVGRGLVRKPHPKYPNDPNKDIVELTSIQSELAEICWFVRGKTLFRRSLLIKPDFDPNIAPSSSTKEPLSYDYLYNNPGLIVNTYYKPGDVDKTGFYNNFDLSVHLEYDPSYPNDLTQATWVPNTLADLTRRENRFANQPLNNVYPYDLRSSSDWFLLGLPTLHECSNASWWPGRPIFNVTLTPDPNPKTSYTLGQFDAWKDPLPFTEVTLTGTSGTTNTKLDPDTGAIIVVPGKDAGPRVAEDVILTDVIGFDVKAWDPGAPLFEYGGKTLAPGDPGYLAASSSGTLVGYGAYVDLGYAPSYSPAAGAPEPWFNGDGNSSSGLTRVYDTWSTHYEKDGVDEDGDGLVDEGTNGLDDDGDGLVDEEDEHEAICPYDKPLRGIQIKIRVFDRDTQQVREITIVHSFLPE